MKSKKYSSSISLAFMTENFKRFWLGSMFALIGYLLACIMPIMVNRDSPEMIESIIKGGFALSVPLVLIIPLFAAILIYRFLQTTSSSSIVHALPLSRKQIFNSSFLSGILLCIVPIILTAALFLVFRAVNGPVLKMVFDPQIGFFKQDVLSASGILIWMVKNCILTAAVFTASMVAAMLTGSTIMQGVLSLVIVMLVPVTTALLSQTASIFIYGYVQPDFMESVQTAFSPVVAALNPEWKYVLCQLAITVLMFILGWILYKKRNIEKASDTLVFGITKPIVKYFLTFLGMCACGLIAYSIQYDNSLMTFFAGAALGTIAVFVGMDVAINKNLKVRRFAIGICKFAAAMIVISLVLMLDLTGYESRIPDADDVKGIEIEGLTQYEYDNAGFGVSGETARELIKDPKAVAIIQSMHGDIIDSKDSFFKNSLKNILSSHFEDDYAGTIYITYHLDNGSTVRRSYEVPVGFYAENENVKEVVETEAYKKSIYPIDLCRKENVEIKSVMVDPSYEGAIFRKNALYLSEVDYDRFLTAIAEDMKELDYAHMGLTGHYVKCQMTVNVTVAAESEIDSEINEQYYKQYGYYYSEPSRTYIFNINDGYTRTVDLLKEMGIYDKLIVLPEDVSYATVSKQLYDYDYGYEQTVNMTEEGEAYEDVANPIDEVNGETITDQEKIAWILENGKDEIDSYDETDGYYYEVRLYPVNTNEEECIYRYFTEETAPDYIKSMF